MKFRHNRELCVTGLDELSDLQSAYEVLQTTYPKTFESLLAKKQAITTKLQQICQEREEVISLYNEGIAALKRYELHPKLAKDPKKQSYLIDIYYSETSMNNFKASVLNSIDKLVTKVAQLDKEFVQH